MAIKFFDFCFEIWPFSNYLHLKTPLEHLEWCSICDLEKIYFTSKLSYVLFCSPTHKTKTRTSKRWGTTNSKPPRPIIMMGQSETVSSSQILFITLFFAGTQRCCAIYQPQQHAQLCGAKSISLNQTGIPWIFFTQFYYANSHIEHCLRCS